MRRLPVRWLAAGMVLALGVAACGGGDDDDSADGDTGPSPDELPECSVDALADATGPVEITLWHSMQEALDDTLKQLTKEFNDSQDKVVVKLVNQTSYTDTRTKYRAGLSTGNLPDLVQIEDTALQFMVDTQSALPAQSCVNAEDYDLSDHIERVVNYYSVEDVLWPMPFNVSNPVLYYDKALFQKAGLDPEKPPASLDEIRDAAQKIVDSGAAPAGIALRSDAWFLEQWLAMEGQTFVNNGNGREARATEVTFGGPEGLEIMQWLHDMAEDKLLVGTGSQEGNLDDYLAVANSNAAMTIQTSAGLGTITQVLNSGQFPNVDLGVGQLPGPKGYGGALVGGAALYITNGENATPEKQAAAWEFAKFLNEAQSQSTWSAGTGYVPIRQSAVDLEPLVTRWKEAPYYKIPYDQLLEGEENAATAGPVIGPYGSRGEGVRGAVIDALDKVMTQGADAKQALDQAVKEANAAITEYNDRVG